MNLYDYGKDADTVRTFFSTEKLETRTKDEQEELVTDKTIHQIMLDKTNAKLDEANSSIVHYIKELKSTREQVTNLMKERDNLMWYNSKIAAERDELAKQLDIANEKLKDCEGTLTTYKKEFEKILAQQQQSYLSAQYKRQPAGYNNNSNKRQKRKYNCLMKNAKYENNNN